MYSHISQIKDVPQETIFLGMAFGVISVLPYKLITDFENTHPHVNIEYSDHADFYLEELLKKDEYDMPCLTHNFTYDTISLRLVEMQDLTQLLIYPLVISTP